MLILSLAEKLAGLGDFALEDTEVLLESLHFKQALLGLIEVDILMHIARHACHTDLALTGCEHSGTACVANLGSLTADRQTPPTVHYVVLLSCLMSW